MARKGWKTSSAGWARTNLPRLRIGIGTPPEGWDWANYVLSKFNREEIADVEMAVGRAAEAVVLWAREGIHACMNRYNALSL